MGILDRLGRAAASIRGADGDYAYPLSRTSERSYPEGFEGQIFYWDIDRTYLATDLDSLTGMLAIPFEFAIDKRSVAGADVLLRALRRPAGVQGAAAPGPSRPLYFISASPPQLRGVIQRKMLMDGVEYDGVTLKDQVALVRGRKLGKLRDHIGYKLCALLLYRLELPWTVDEYLFGDDTELDSLIYALYADVVAGRLRGELLERTLRARNVAEEDVDYAVRLADQLPQARDLVGRIYLHLDRRTPPSRFTSWGPALVPCYDTFQMALHLYGDGLLGPEAVVQVGRVLADKHDRSRVGLVRSALDLADRGSLALGPLASIWERLVDEHLVPDFLMPDPARVEADTTERARAAAAGADPDAFVTPAEFLVEAD